MGTFKYTKPKVTSLPEKRKKTRCKKVFCSNKYKIDKKGICDGYCAGSYATGTVCPRVYSS